MRHAQILAVICPSALVCAACQRLFAAEVIEHDLTEEGGKLKFSYTLDSGAENFISRNLVDITVEALPENAEN